MGRGAGVLCWIGGPFDDLFIFSYATAVAVFFSRVVFWRQESKSVLAALIGLVDCCCLLDFGQGFSCNWEVL